MLAELFEMLIELFGMLIEWFEMLIELFEMLIALLKLLIELLEMLIGLSELLIELIEPLVQLIEMLIPLKVYITVSYSFVLAYILRRKGFLQNYRTHKFSIYNVLTTYPAIESIVIGSTIILMSKIDYFVKNF